MTSIMVIACRWESKLTRLVDGDSAVAGECDQTVILQLRKQGLVLLNLLVRRSDLLIGTVKQRYH